MQYHYFETAGYVSIWIGEFPSEEIGDQHLRERYGERGDDEPLAEWMGEFGFRYFDHDFMDTNGHGPSVGPLRPLIEPCSYATSFVDEAMLIAAQQRIAETQFVMLLYDFRYDPAVTGVTQGRYLRFLGAFRYQQQHPQ
jgi:hypothetical protein